MAFCTVLVGSLLFGIEPIGHVDTEQPHLGSGQRRGGDHQQRRLRQSRQRLRRDQNIHYDQGSPCAYRGAQRREHLLAQGPQPEQLRSRRLVGLEPDPPCPWANRGNRSVAPRRRLSAPPHPPASRVPLAGRGLGSSAGHTSAWPPKLLSPFASL